MVKLSLALAMAAALLSQVAAAQLTIGASGFTAPNNSLAFAINLPDDGSNDLYFSLSAQSNLSWAAVGMGNNQMLNTLVFMMYRDSSGGNITLSPRLSPELAEPVYSSDIELSLLSGTGVSDGRMLVNAICHNCRNWPEGSINPNDTASPFIFARGPYQSFKSNSVTASVMIHEEYGSFTMNLSQAIGPAHVPSATSRDEGELTLDIVSDSHYNTVMHGYLMVTGIMVVMPVGSLASRCMSGVRTSHAIFQSLGGFLVVCGLYFGTVVSLLYNRSNHFFSAHQMLGFTVVICVVYQGVLGLRLHRGCTYRLSPYDDSIPFHVWMGRFIIYSGTINAFLGIQLSYRVSQLAPFFAIVASIWFVFDLVAFILWVSKRMKRRQEHQVPEDNRSEWSLSSWVSRPVAAHF